MIALVILIVSTLVVWTTLLIGVKKRLTTWQGAFWAGLLIGCMLLVPFLLLGGAS
jgi:hypothetical protein